MSATYVSNVCSPRRWCWLLRQLLVVGLAAVLFVGSASFADEPRYRVVLEDLPGADEVEAGNFQAGIRLLESQLENGKSPGKAGLWSTLCAAYIYAIALDKAEDACDKAVDVDASYAALNNRGVLRVYKRDLSGAQSDFDRVRPLRVDAYLQELRTTNIRLVAASNFELLEELLKKQDQVGRNSRSALDVTEIEELNPK